MAITDSKAAQNLKYTGRPVVEALTVTWDGTNAVYSSVYDKTNVYRSMFLVKNDEGTADLGIVVEGSDEASFTNPYTVATSVTATHGTYKALAVVTDPWPFLRLKITPTATVAKTTNTFRVVSGVRII